MTTVINYYSSRFLSGASSDEEAPDEELPDEEPADEDSPDEEPPGEDSSDEEPPDRCV